jgi:membrane-bound serine protease (ClpP class)
MRLNIFSKTGFIRIAIAFALLLASRAASAEVLKIVVNDTIHPLTAEYFDRAIQEAQRTHADALLIELNTPGGMMISMEEIVQKLLAASVPTIIYVTPAGGSASSAGFFILEAADVAAMAPGTNTGTAHPVLGGGAVMDPVMKEKMENYGASLMRSYTTKRGRNANVAETAVRNSKTFTAEEALAQHLVEFIAADEGDLLRQLEGKTVTRFDGSKVVLHLAGKPVRLYEMTVKQRILTWLMNPNITFILLSIGLMAIYAEFNHPGAVVPGVVGFVFVVLSLVAFGMLPTNYVGMIMILGAFVLFALEAKFQSHGALGISGVLLMIFGALLLVDGPIPQMRIQVWTALGVSLPMGLITIFLMTIALRARRSKVVTGEQGMVGEIGLVTAALVPAGKVFVQGELWDAVAPSSVEAGSRVVVRGVENLVLQVEPVHEASAQTTQHG